MPWGYQLRVKGPLLLLICVLVTSVFYLFIGPDVRRSSLQSIVSETHHRLSQRLRSVVDVREGARDVDEAIESDELQLKYLTSLGFIRNPRLYRVGATNASLPVFVTAVKGDQTLAALNLMRQVQELFPDHQLFVYTLNLDEDELKSLNTSCNLSCSLLKFDFDIYPSHVSDLKLYAFRPLIIQSLLDKTGAVVWLEPDVQILPVGVEKAREAFNRASLNGLYSWTIDQPTSSMTHPKMFEFFGDQPENFFFQRMIDGNCLIIFNTEKVHKYIMESWVRCSLTAYCISPIGAQVSKLSGLMCNSLTLNRVRAADSTRNHCTVIQDATLMTCRHSM